MEPTAATRPTTPEELLAARHREAEAAWESVRPIAEVIGMSREFYITEYVGTFYPPVTVVEAKVAD